MKIRRRISILLIWSVLLLCGCSNREVDPAAAAPVKSTVICNDTFRITCTSGQYEYNSKEIQKEDPFNFELQLEYIGEEPSVTIWRSESIGGIEMLYANRESVLPLVIGDTRGSTELKKGEVYTIYTWTGSSEYEHVGGFSCGNYIAFACVDFGYGEDGEESVRCVLEMPFVIV